MLCFKYRLILSYLYSLESHLCSRFMYLKTAEVWLRTSRLGQIVFRIYSVEQLLLYCELRDFYLLQSPLSLRWTALLVTALRYLTVSLSRTLSATYQAPARIGYTRGGGGSEILAEEWMFCCDGATGRTERWMEEG